MVVLLYLWEGVGRAGEFWWREMARLKVIGFVPSLRVIIVGNIPVVEGIPVVYPAVTISRHCQ
jgi:hypothetical protein